jgi:PAS domain S-box-containing protein
MLMNSKPDSFFWLDLALSSGEVGAWYWNLEDPAKKIERTEIYNRIFGLHSHQVWTRDDLFNHIHPSDRASIVAKFDCLFDGNSAEYQAEYRIIRDDGETRWVSASGKGLREDNGKVVRIAGSIRDITEEKRVRKDRDQFIATLSHDLRNPLSIASASAGLIKSGKAQKPLKYADMILNAVGRADRIIQDLLDLSRSQTGQLIPLAFKNCDFGQVVKEIINDLSIQYADRFRLETIGDFKGSFAAEALRRVLENLAINAVKYSSPGTPIHVQLRRNENTITLSVTNEGTPIPMEDQKSLFELFSRSRSAELSSTLGWGLGLSIVQNIAESLGGSVVVESNETVGTIFRIEFPLSTDNPQLAQHESAAVTK